MKKILNIIGYIFLVSIPYLLLVFLCECHNLVKIIILTVLLIIINIQIKNYRKTKVKDYGIRIFISLIIITTVGLTVHHGYGLVKNIQAKELSRTIQKISFEEFEIDAEKIENNLEFINTKGLIFKGSYDAIIYYKDGTEEKTKVYCPGFYVINIKHDKYYLEI